MLQEKGSDDNNHSTRMHSTIVMESDIGDLAQYLVDQLDSLQLPEPRRLLVGISGIPASGKTTFAQILVERINHILNQPRTQDIERPQAILVGLDGWHLTRAQLDVFPDPQTAHDRRGSHWTFDGASYVSFVRALRDGASVINAPSFDHALKDPTPDAVSIYPYHRIVIIEGLYVFLAIKPWSEGGLLLDERWFVQVDPVEARKRLVKRHVLTGVAKDLEEAEWRADENDGPNGLFLIGNMLEPTRIIKSKDDPSLEFESKPTLPASHSIEYP